MNTFAFSSLLTLLTCGALSIFVFWKGHGKKVANILALFSLSIAFWGFSSFKFTTSLSLDRVMIWMKIAHISVVYTTILYAHFVFSFLDLKRKLLLIFLYTLGTIWMIMNFFTEKLHLFDARFVFNQFYWFDVTKYKSISYLIFCLIFYFVLLGYALFLLVKNYSTSVGIKRLQLKYLIFASILGWLGPHGEWLLTFGIPLYPYSNFLIIPVPFIWAYSILRHQLMDIKVVIKKTIIFLAMLAFISILLIIPILFLQGTHFCGKINDMTKMGLSLPASIWTVSNLLVGLICLILILIVLRFATAKIHYFLAFFNSTVAVWGFGAFFIGLARNPFEAAVAWKIACLGGLISPMVFYHMINVLSGARKWKIISSFYIYGAVIILFIFINLFDFKIIRIYDSLYYLYSASFIWKILALAWIGIIIYSLFELFKLFKSSAGVKKRQYRYLLIGFVMGFSAAIWDALPTIGICVYPASNIFMCFYCILITYAILRHQLLDIEVVIKKTLLFGGIFVSVYVIFAFFALLGQIFFERFIMHNRWIAMIPSVVIVTIMLRPLENFLVNVTDRYLFQKKYDYKKLLRTFTSEVLTVLELDKLIRLTEDKLMEIMKLESCEFVEIASPRLNSGGPRNDEELSRPRNDEGPRDDVVLKLPISMNNKAMGILLLGRKKSDEEYTQEDLDILQSLTKALGIAISNAKLFDELSRTQAEVAQKDKMATIGTLAAGMAHEIRNPITTIRNFADYLPEEYDNTYFMNKFDKLIPKEIDRIETIARSLLELSSFEIVGKREEFVLYEPVKTIIAILEPQYRAADIKIICTEKGKHIIEGNRIHVQDALFYIMNYALSETQDRSRIFVECEDAQGRAVLYIRCKDLIVADHIMKDVFEPVSALYREKRGFGFNLFMAKQLLERNEAELAISSDISKGAEFRISFKNVSGRPS